MLTCHHAKAATSGSSRCFPPPPPNKNKFLRSQHVSAPLTSGGSRPLHTTYRWKADWCPHTTHPAEKQSSEWTIRLETMTKQPESMLIKRVTRRFLLKKKKNLITCFFYLTSPVHPRGVTRTLNREINVWIIEEKKFSSNDYYNFKVLTDWSSDWFCPLLLTVTAHCPVWLMGILGEPVVKMHTPCKDKEDSRKHFNAVTAYFRRALWVPPRSLRSAGLSGCSSAPSLFLQLQLQIRPGNEMNTTLSPQDGTKIIHNIQRKKAKGRGRQTLPVLSQLLHLRLQALNFVSKVLFEEPIGF